MNSITINIKKNHIKIKQMMNTQQKKRTNSKTNENKMNVDLPHQAQGRR